MLDRLVELINEAKDEYPTTPSVNCCKPTFAYYLAHHLLTNGVIVLPHKPINVMCIEDSTDVCCPYCETILSGLYGEEPTDIIQCYICGAFLDNTGAITREEAERSLKGEPNG